MACRACFSGSLHTDTPTGTVTTLHGLPTYVSEPEGGAAPKGLIVNFCDAFGWELPNARALADRYARRTGCRVYTPDFQGGHWFEHDLLETMEYVTEPQPTWGATFYKIFPALRMVYHLVPFVLFNRDANVRPRVLQFFRGLRRAEGASLPVGIAGFCFGGFYTFELVKDAERVDGKPLVDCGFTAHPSFLTVPKSGDEAKQPVSVLVGDEDMALSHDKSLILQKALEKNPVQHEMYILPGVKHGFAVRWDPHDEKQSKRAQEAEDQAVAWFKKHFKI